MWSEYYITKITTQHHVIKSYTNTKKHQNITSLSHVFIITQLFNFYAVNYSYLSLVCLKVSTSAVSVTQ